MEVGQLNKRIDLISVVRDDDGSGGKTRADTLLATVWANVKQSSWSQSQRAERLEQRVSHVVTIRWRPDFATGFGPEGRARYADHGGVVRELSVKTVVDPDGRGNWLELGCDEGGPV